jgi:hypothetical protein
MRYRGGVFALSGEFDAMPERITHLRRHLDLGGLEPELQELTTQMSLESRDLARIFCDDKIKRAKTFLEQRQQKADTLLERDLRDILPTLGYELEDGGTQPNLVPMPKK